jgi:hypothetical protein
MEAKANREALLRKNDLREDIILEVKTFSGCKGFLSIATYATKMS